MRREVVSDFEANGKGELCERRERTPPEVMSDE
jgi:hypothetical protein